MNVQEVLSQSRDAMTVGRVFGEPIERNSVTIVPDTLRMDLCSLLGGPAT